jgi:hypothetical protein
VSPNWFNTGFLTTAIDWNISEKDQIRGRYLHAKTNFIDAAAQLPVFYTTLSTPYHVIAITEYHQFTPMVTNEFRVGYNRTGTNWIVPTNMSFLPTLDAFPNITLDELSVNVGPDPNAPQYALQNLYQAVDNLSWTKGNHTLKFGVEGRKYITPQKFIQRSRGDYEYGTVDAFANDFAPDGGLAERSFGTVGYSGDQYGIFWYANDTWKIRPNFTINLGLRYEYTSTPYGWTQQSLNSVADAPGIITFGSPKAPRKDFMPRIGFAYSPGTSGNTSIRGGFGLGYDVLYDNIGVLSRPPQIGSTIDCPTQCAATGFLANGGIPPQPGLTGITTLDQADARALTASFLPNNVKYPYAISWNLGVQHVFAKDYTAEVRYVGTHGNALNVQNRINVVDTVTPTNYLPTYFTAPSQATLDALPVTLTDLVNEYNNGAFFDQAYLNAGFYSEIVGFMPWGNSIYHGLQSQLNRRFSNGLQFQAAYTWSHAIDNSTADFFSTIIAPRRPENFRNLNAERANSVLNHTHRLTISAIYDVPWYKHGNWFQRNVLGNYEFTPVYTFETPQFGTLQSGRDVNLNTDGAGDRIIINPNATSNTATSETALKNTAGDVVAYIPTDLTAKYVRASTGTLTTSGRSTLPVAHINNWDISLAKHIAFTERYRIDFMFQMLNALNHPQYIGGSLNQINQIGQTGSLQRNFFIPTTGNFNNLKDSWSSNPRTAQVVLKFIF